MPAPAFSLALQGDSELAEALKRKIAPPELLADAAARGVSNLVVDHLRARRRAPGIALHRYGGTVRPTSGRSLAIPARAEVAGVWPREWTQREAQELFAWWPKGRRAGALARRESSGHLTVLWWLVGATHHKADETVLPDAERMQAAAFDAALDALDAYRAGRGA